MLRFSCFVQIKIFNDGQNCSGWVSTHQSHENYKVLVCMLAISSFQLVISNEPNESADST
jgi:hypothetical protein